MYRADFDTKLPSTPSTQINKATEHLPTIQDFLIGNEALFTAEGTDIPSPFIKLHRKQNRDGIYLEYHVAHNALVNHQLPALKSKFSEWFTTWEVSNAHFSFHVSTSSPHIPMQTANQPAEPTTASVMDDITQLRSNIQTITPNMSASDQQVIMTNFNDAHSELESINSAASEF